MELLVIAMRDGDYVRTFPYLGSIRPGALRQMVDHTLEKYDADNVKLRLNGQIIYSSATDPERQ